MEIHSNQININYNKVSDTTIKNNKIKQYNNISFGDIYFTNEAYKFIEKNSTKNFLEIIKKSIEEQKNNQSFDAIIKYLKEKNNLFGFIIPKKDTSEMIKCNCNNELSRLYNNLNETKNFNQFINDINILDSKYMNYTVDNVIEALFKNKKGLIFTPDSKEYIKTLPMKTLNYFITWQNELNNLKHINLIIQRKGKVLNLFLQEKINPEKLVNIDNEISFPSKTVELDIPLTRGWTYSNEFINAISKIEKYWQFPNIESATEFAKALDNDIQKYSKRNTKNLLEEIQKSVID